MYVAFVVDDADESDEVGDFLGITCLTKEAFHVVVVGWHKCLLHPNLGTAKKKFYSTLGQLAIPFYLLISDPKKHPHLIAKECFGLFSDYFF